MWLDICGIVSYPAARGKLPLKLLQSGAERRPEIASSSTPHYSRLPWRERLSAKNGSVEKRWKIVELVGGVFSVLPGEINGEEKTGRSADGKRTGKKQRAGESGT